jgi:hypothetical protein
MDSVALSRDYQLVKDLLKRLMLPLLYLSSSIFRFIFIFSIFASLILSGFSCKQI